MIEMLYKKKIIRDFLSLFTENHWKQLIASLVEYGIIHIKKHHNIASLTPEEIFQIVETLKKEENLISDKKKSNKFINKSSKIEDTNQRGRTRSKSKSSFKDLKPIQGKINNMFKSFNSNVKTPSKDRVENNISKDKILVNGNKRKLGLGYGYTVKSSLTPNKIKIKTNNFNKVNLSEQSASGLLSVKSQKPIIKTESSSRSQIERSNSNSFSNNKTIKNQISNIVSNKNINLESNSHLRNKSKEREPPLELTILNKLKEKKRNNITIQKPEENTLVTTTENIKEDKKYSTKYSTIESKIKGALENDKKMYNMLKSQNRNENESSVVKKNDSKSIDDNKRQINSAANKLVNFNNPKQSILSLEERLNGLSQKISNVEKSSISNYR